MHFYPCLLAFCNWDWYRQQIQIQKTREKDRQRQSDNGYRELTPSIKLAHYRALTLQFSLWQIPVSWRTVFWLWENISFGLPVISCNTWQNTPRNQSSAKWRKKSIFGSNCFGLLFSFIRKGVFLVRLSFVSFIHLFIFIHPWHVIAKLHVAMRWKPLTGCLL